MGDTNTGAAASAASPDIEGQRRRRGMRGRWRALRLAPERLRWAVRVRWLVLAGFLSLGLLAGAAGLFSSMRPLAVTAALGAAMNALNGWCVRRQRRVLGVSAAAIGLDLVLITTLVVSTGGVESPFVVLYFVQVLATAMLVDTAVAAGTAVFGMVLWLTAISAQSAGYLRWELSGGLIRDGSEVVLRWAWASFTLYCLGLLVYLGGYISGRLRASEDDLAEEHRRLQAALGRLEATHGHLQAAYARLQETEAQLVHAEKMRSLGQLVAGVAHELNNPMSFVLANLQHVRVVVERLQRAAGARAALPLPGAARPSVDARWPDGGIDALVAEVPALLDDCEEGARRAVGIVAELRTFSRTNEHDAWRLADVHRGLESTLTMLAWRCARRVVVHRDFGAIPAVECLPGQLNQVFMNLLSNALDALGAHGGNIWVTTRAHPVPGGAEGVRISVRDDGCGMTEAVRVRACEPFFTTKPVGQGTGLGLSVSFAIVARHGGVLAVESAPGAGSTVAVTLPARQPGSV